jgi:hypothetical protein
VNPYTDHCSGLSEQTRASKRAKKSGLTGNALEDYTGKHEQLQFFICVHYGAKQSRINSVQIGGPIFNPTSLFLTTQFYSDNTFAAANSGLLMANFFCSSKVRFGRSGSFLAVLRFR